MVKVINKTDEPISERTVTVKNDVPSCPECNRFHSDDADFLIGWESYEHATLRCPNCWYVFDSVEAQAGNIKLE